MVSDYDAKSNDYETTIDYDSATIKRLWRRLFGGETTMDKATEEENNYRLCPLKLHALLSTPEAVIGTLDYRAGVRCSGNVCAWYDQTAERCAVLSMARNK